MILKVSASLAVLNLSLVTVAALIRCEVKYVFLESS